MYQKTLGRTANASAAGLCVDHDIQSLLRIRRFVEIDDAEVIDLRLERWMPNDFEGELLNMTPVPRIFVYLGRNWPALGLLSGRREWLLYALDQLAAVPRQPGPKFVFAHIEAPHGPFVFGADGEWRDIALPHFQEYTNEEMKLYRDSYVDQLQYVNKRMESLIDTIISQASVPPVIVVQGDHGLRLSLNRNIDEMCMRENFANLTAFHLPGVEIESQIPETFSPVNTFRLVLNEYFDADLVLLPDRSWVAWQDWGEFTLTEVTDTVESCTDAWQQKVNKSFE